MSELQSAKTLESMRDVGYGGKYKMDREKKGTAWPQKYHYTTRGHASSSVVVSAASSSNVQIVRGGRGRVMSGTRGVIRTVNNGFRGTAGKASLLRHPSWTIGDAKMRWKQWTDIMVGWPWTGGVERTPTQEVKCRKTTKAANRNVKKLSQRISPQPQPVGCCVPMMENAAKKLVQSIAANLLIQLIAIMRYSGMESATRPFCQGYIPLPCFPATSIAFSSRQTHQRKQIDLRQMAKGCRGALGNLGNYFGRFCRFFSSSACFHFFKQMDISCGISFCDDAIFHADYLVELVYMIFHNNPGNNAAKWIYNKVVVEGLYELHLYVF
ncbi:hypothetical protein DMENIID0001_032690 [Sergentomyia squamirostris]